MSQALYRRYRPQTFEDVIGQDHVTHTLRNALRLGRVGHAYLFTGPRGTGKTSTARILAKAVNCLAEDVAARPDNACDICQAINEGRLLDLIEIDAASNTSVDDVRELRDRVAFAPSEAAYKVYVIDEVHMLSTSAFNALLKTLEEPPAHVIFILATTEPHKIPATILSRCQRFDFHRISTRQIAEHLTELAAREQVRITPEAVGIIARSATGSMRDAISLLDQITAYGHEEIDAELVRDVLGMVSGAAIAELVDALADRDPVAVLSKLHELIAQGVDLTQLVAQLIDHLRTLLLLNVGRDASLVDLPDSMLATTKAQAEKFKPTQILHAIRSLNDAALSLKTAFGGYLPVEMALLDAIGLGVEQAASPAAQPQPARASAPARTAPARAAGPSPARSPAPPPSRPTATRPAASAPSASPELMQQWGQVLRAVRPSSTKMEAILRSGKPLHVRGDELVVFFKFQFHREQVLNEVDLVNKAISQVMGRPMTIRVVDENYQPPANDAVAPAVDSSPASPPSQPPADPLLEAAKDLGAVVTPIEET
ncbi:MAG: DNA polymerase III subunit gamma/tau [Chloroflexi bacterium]|nr:DNA polymerase III subunit gamma/tau [Chloroflexota bacterium]